MDLVALGVPFDLGATNRAGAREGPRAIREQTALAGLLPPHYPWSYTLTERFRIADYGDVAPLPGTDAVQFMLRATEAAAGEVLSAGASLLTLGGDHTVSYGPLRAAAERFGPVALVHVDAHQDSCDPEDFPQFPIVNHGTFAGELAREGGIDLSRSTQVYVRTRMLQPGAGDYAIVDAEQALEMGPRALARTVVRRAGEGPVYLSFDIDAVDPAYAPGTGTPVPGGPTSADVRRFLRGLGGLDIVAGDLVEVNPAYDPAGITSLLAAHLAIDMLYLMGAARTGRAARA